MPAAANLLFLVAMLLMVAAGLVTHLLPSLAATRLLTALLVTVTGVVVALALVAVVHRSWWDVVTAVFLAAGAAVVWDVHLSARTGRPSRMVQRQVRRTLVSQRGGRRLQTLAELRAEYGQTILDDAGRDSVLNCILDEYAGRIAEQVREPKGQVGIGEPDRLTAYANGYVDSLSEPGRQARGPAYRGYSTEMLMIAAVCRTAERLQARRDERAGPR